LACKPSRHLYIDPGSLDLLKRMPVPEVAKHLVCSKCGARNDATRGTRTDLLGQMLGQSESFKIFYSNNNALHTM
jgi:hypothetical protein